MESSRYVSRLVKERRRRGRIFHVFMSGLTRAVHFHRRLRVMHLTSHVGYDMSRLSKDFQVLRKRIEHFFHFSMEYVKVNTAEGNGVVHCVYFPVGLDGSSVGWNIGYIPQQWLSETWRDITGGSFIVGLNELHVRRGLRRLVNYLVAQYFSGQSALERISYSSRWCFRGFRSLWRVKFAYRYFLDRVSCLFDWNKVLFLELSLLAKRFPDFVRLEGEQKELGDNFGSA
jgi:hypothetical protein